MMKDGLAEGRTSASSTRPNGVSSSMTDDCLLPVPVRGGDGGRGGRGGSGEECPAIERHGGPPCRRLTASGGDGGTAPAVVQGPPARVLASPLLPIPTGGFRHANRCRHLCHPRRRRARRRPARGPRDPA